MPRLSLFFLFATIAFHPHAARCADRSHPNIILVTASGIRSDRLPFLGGRHATSAIDGLARHSLIFEYAYAQSPATVASHATILTGTYPQTHRASEFGSLLSAEVPFLPDSLHAQGYRTAAFVGSIDLDSTNGFSPGFERGFDVYDAGFSFLNPADHRNAQTARAASDVIQRAIRWVGETPPPFFLWINLDDAAQAHDPASYTRAIDTVDAAVRPLFEFLQQKGLFEDAAIVLCADHGESLGAHGEDGHGIFLYDETTHVPLVIKLPANQMAGKRVAGRVSLLGIAPSLLEIAGLAVPSRMQGQSLIRQAESKAPPDQPVYARSDFPANAFGWSPLESWRVGKYLYIRAPQPELYDLKADPGARRNLAPTSRATLATIAAQLADFDRHFQSASESKPQQLDSSDMQKLASLGYVGLQKAAPKAETGIAGPDPKDFISIANKTLRAWSSLHHGDAKLAALTFRSVIDAQPKSFLAQWGLGSALALEKQFGRAVGPLRSAIELQPHVAWVHYQMGICLERLNNQKAAAIHFEIASHLAPESALFRLRLNGSVQRN